jgi:hypothetical protein
MEASTPFPSVTPTDKETRMASHEYFVAPFVGKIKSGLFSHDGPETASKQLSSFIEHYQNQGWEFDRLGSIHILVQPGCLAALFGATASMVVFDQVIFRRPLKRTSVPVEHSSAVAQPRDDSPTPTSAH